MTARHRLIVDWGTSNFRAFRFDEAGEVAETRQAPRGILTVEAGGFEAVLRAEIGDWIDEKTEILLSGMITSRNGWLETPYIEAPARLDDLRTGAVTSRLAQGTPLLFLPGVCARHPTPDVMRGEEIQVFGSIGPDEDATLVLPGTHSKWVRTRRGALADFRTFMTGEVFATLKAHTILGRLMPENAGPFDETSFIAGVRQAQTGGAGLLHDLFTTRSGVLLSQLAPEAAADRLSGLLIGAEIAGGIALGWADPPILLVGEAKLCARYRLALESLDLSARLGPAQPTVEGFRKLAMLEGKSA